MVEDGLERARRLAADGDVDGAVRVLTDHVGATPEDAFAHLQLANLLLAQGDAAGAVERFEQALALEPDNALVHNDLGTALERLGREDEAAAAYRRGAHSQPPYPPAQYNLARLHGRRGQWREAAELLRASVDQTRGFRAARLELGLVLRRLGDEDGARACFDTLLADDSRDLETRRVIADSEMSQCRFADAAEHLEQCLALAPEDAKTILALGSCLQELGRVAEALTHYRRLLVRDRSRYYEVVKKLTGASTGCFWVNAEALRRALLG
jgi:Flp pilus assembly protein TadD